MLRYNLTKISGTEEDWPPERPMVQQPNIDAPSISGGHHREPPSSSSNRMGLGIGYTIHQNAGYNKLFTQVLRLF